MCTGSSSFFDCGDDGDCDEVDDNDGLIDFDTDAALLLLLLLLLLLFLLLLDDAP